MAAYSYYLSLSGLVIRLDTDQILLEEAAFAPFLTQACKPDVTAVFRQVSQLPPIPETVLYEDLCYRVHPDGKGGFIRTFFDAPRDLSPYALAAYDYAGGLIRVDYLEKGAHCLCEMTNTFFHLALEALLIYHGRLCLHAACVETPLGGILFSGPSGIGKSTQAELWCKYRGARQINGDRPILSAHENGWLAWGSPYAGSSDCHINESTAVKAVVILRQGSSNSLRALAGSEAFRAIWSGVTVPLWDNATAEKACDLALAIVNTVPVLEFTCMPDVSAVEALERGLEAWSK